MELLDGIAAWEKLFERSGEQPFIVFKHSLICPTSQAAEERMEQAEKRGMFPVAVYVVPVQEFRDLSNMIERMLNVEHATPQVLVIKAGQCVYDASHDAIDPAAVAQAVKES